MEFKIFDITDCNKRCWECSRVCTMKEMFLLPEQEFNYQILMSLKTLQVGIFFKTLFTTLIYKKEVF